MKLEVSSLVPWNSTAATQRTELNFSLFSSVGIALFILLSQNLASPTASASQLPACSSIEIGTPVELGTRCQTSVGEIFEYKSSSARPGFGQGWADPSGLVWSEAVHVDRPELRLPQVQVLGQSGAFSHRDATDICQRAGARLPSAGEIQFAARAGIREVPTGLMNEYGPRQVWTSSWAVGHDVAFLSPVFGDFSYHTATLRAEGIHWHPLHQTWGDASAVCVAR